MKTIRINPLSQSSVENAIMQIEALQAKLKKLEEFNKYLQTLEGAGVAIAQMQFDQGYLYNPFEAYGYGGDYGNVTVTSKMTDNGFVIEANGEQVLFMEFGAGITYSGEAYEGERPEGIVGIGQYGKGRGSRRAWGYYNPNSKSGLTITYGVPALQGMYRAKKHIMQEVEKKVKELLND